MANRRFQRSQALEREVKQLFCEWTQDSGNPVIDKALGIESVVKNATGDFTITLQDAYNRLMGVTGVVKGATAEDISIQLKSEDVAGAKTIDIITHTAGTDTDPSDGNSVLLKIEVKNTSVER